MTGLWWLWIVGGLAVAVLELLLPGYVFVGMALGAVATGALLWSGLWPAEWMAQGLPNSALVFAVLSLVAWAGLRWGLGVRKGQVKVWTRDINED